MTGAILVLVAVLAIVAAVGFYFKNNYAVSAPAMLVAAFVASLVAGMGIRVREVVEGMFGYFYPLLSVLCAALLVKFLYDNGTFDFIFDKVAAMSGAGRSIALLLFIGIPGMLTGTATMSLLTTGAIAGAQLRKSGMDSAKATTFVAAGCFLGMMMPPISLPGIVAVCSSIASGGYFAAYNGYTVPLLCMALPALIVYGAMAAGSLPEKIEGVGATGSASCLVPLAAVLVLVLCHDFLPSLLPFIGLPLIMVIGALLSIVLGGGKRPNLLESVTEAMRSIAPPVAIAMAAGSLLEIYMMTGTAGYIGAAQYFTDYRVVGLIFGIIAIALGLFFDAPAALAILVLACFAGSNNMSFTAVDMMPMYYAAILGAAASVCVRNGLAGRVAEAIGAEGVDEKQAVLGFIVPVAIVLVIGMVFAFTGSSLAVLRI